MSSCQQMVKDRCLCGNENLLFFCLIFKEYLSKCPSSCSYFIEGPCHSMNYFFQSELEMECPYFYLIVINPHTSDHFPFFVCGVTGKTPDCNHCPLEE